MRVLIPSRVRSCCSRAARWPAAACH